MCLSRNSVPVTLDNLQPLFYTVFTGTSFNRGILTLFLQRYTTVEVFHLKCSSVLNNTNKIPFTSIVLGWRQELLHSLANR